MEKRFFGGIGILVVFLLLGFWTAGLVGKANKTVEQALNQAVRAVEAGDFSLGTELAGLAKEKWQSAWKGIASVADHNPMDEIDGLFSQMEFYARTGAKREFGACCARIGELVRAISDEHRLTWWNLM